MRVYEFAQLHNVSSKDIIEKLHKNGFDVKSHMSVLDEKALSFLNTSTVSAQPDTQEAEVLKNSNPVNTIEGTVIHQQQSRATRPVAKPSKKTTTKNAGDVPIKPVVSSEIPKEQPA